MPARHLWEAVEDDDVDFHDDRSALDVICSGMPPEMVPTLATKPSAKEAWEVICSMRIGDERVRKLTAQSLRAEYEQITFCDGESVEYFALCLSNIVQRLAILGDLEPEPGPKVVAKYLRVARPRYKQLVVSIETILDIDTLFVEEVTGWLKVATDDEPSLDQDVAGKLLLTEEQWLERYRKRDKDSGHDGSSSSGRGKRRGRGRGRGTDSGNDSRASSNLAQTIADDACKACGEKGHWAKDCRSKKKFGDGSTTRIEGIGTVLLSYKNDEHRAIANVYYLPHLTANIISIGQLDEIGYQVLVEDGVMRVRDEERRLLAKIHHNLGWLYMLDVDIVRPVCLAAQGDKEAWVWHARFGHLHFTALHKMGRDGLVRGLPLLTQVE
ncbi:uncharacterized protein [Miscanthus floridulus]|uniref:uncharacterized protein n=1 Tax=Miscanthus floridulus TaxID=154761 RepID=UPI00345AAF11